MKTNKKAECRGGSQSAVLLALTILAVVLPVVAWEFRTHKGADVTADGEARAVRCAPGPWGNMEAVTIDLEPPDRYVTESLEMVEPTRWLFKNFNTEQLGDFLRASAFGAEEAQWLLQHAAMESTPQGVWVSPGEDFVLRMHRETRQRIYAKLAEFRENGFHNTPFVFRPQQITRILDRSGLSPSTISTFTNLCYPHESLLFFSDVSALLSTVNDNTEKLRVIKTISRKSTLLVKLKISPGDNVEQLVDYWGIGGRAKDIRPLLESLSRVNGGCAVDLIHLLPPFARQRMYTYPAPRLQTNLPNENCHWTALNFFNESPDDRYRDAKAVQAAIDEDYDVISGDKRLGDVALFVNGSGVIVHSAVYIADDILFCKMGGRENQPWVFMKTDELLPYYEMPGQHVHIVYCRKKALGNS